eukprot:1142238-Pelagomonas_calceolata.AAC.1
MDLCLSCTSSLLPPVDVQILTGEAEGLHFARPCSPSPDAPTAQTPNAAGPTSAISSAAPTITPTANLEGQRPTLVASPCMLLCRHLHLTVRQHRGDSDVRQQKQQQE